MHNQEQLWYNRLRVADETKLQTLVPSLNVDIHTKTKLKNPTQQSANPENFNHWIQATRSIIPRITTRHDLE